MQMRLSGAFVLAFIALVVGLGLLVLLSLRVTEVSRQPVDLPASVRVSDSAPGQGSPAPLPAPAGKSRWGLVPPPPWF